jgi:hypothetical protein
MRRSSGSSSEPNGNDPASFDDVAVALDDAQRGRGVVGAHRDAALPRLVVQRQWKAVRELSLSTGGVDAVRLEQAADHVASISDGVWKMTTELAHTATSLFDGDRSSILIRIIVMSSC